MLAQVPKACSGRETIPGEILRRQGHECLTTVGRSQETGQAVQPWSEIVPVL